MYNDIVFHGDEYVVHIDKKPFSIQFTYEDVIHHMLKGGGQVAEAKEHNCWFKEAMLHNECSFPLISLCNVDIVVAPIYIHLHKQQFSLKFVNKISNPWEGVGVLLGPFIDRGGCNLLKGFCQ